MINLKYKDQIHRHTPVISTKTTFWVIFLDECVSKSDEVFWNTSQTLQNATAETTVALELLKRA